MSTNRINKRFAGANAQSVSVPDTGGSQTFPANTGGSASSSTQAAKTAKRKATGKK